MIFVLYRCRSPERLFVIRFFVCKKNLYFPAYFSLTFICRSLSLFIGIIELMAQNGSNIDLIDDIDFTLFARDFRMTADNNAV